MAVGLRRSDGRSTGTSVRGWCLLIRVVVCSHLQRAVLELEAQPARRDRAAIDRLHVLKHAMACGCHMIAR